MRKSRIALAEQYKNYNRSSIAHVNQVISIISFLSQVIDINSASYPAWAYRWQCLAVLSKEEDLRSEKAFLEQVAANNVKNYQLWNHRRQLAFRSGPESCSEVFSFLRFVQFPWKS